MEQMAEAFVDFSVAREISRKAGTSQRLQRIATQIHRLQIFEELTFRSRADALAAVGRYESHEHYRYLKFDNLGAGLEHPFDDLPRLYRFRQNARCQWRCHQMYNSARDRTWTSQAHSREGPVEW